jgi:hypothetical protein
MTIISGTADHRFPIFVSIFIIVVRNMPKYPHLFPSLDQAIFWNLMLRLLQMASLGSIFQKISGGACPRNPLGCLASPLSMERLVNSCKQPCTYYQSCCKVVPTSPIQSWYKNIVITLCRQPCNILVISWLYQTVLEQPCNKSDNAINVTVLQVVNSLFQTCYNNWEQADDECEHNFSTACGQISNNSFADL